MLKKASRSKDADVPDVRADEPERAMEQFTDGLRRVLAVSKHKPAKQRRGASSRQKRAM